MIKVSEAFSSDLSTLQMLSVKHFELYLAFNQQPSEINLNSYIKTTHFFVKYKSFSFFILSMKFDIAYLFLILKTPSFIVPSGILE